MKRFRILFGLLIIIFAGWLIVDEQLSGTSANATINAQLATVRTPIAGQLGDFSIPLGARLDADETLVDVRNVRADSVRLNDLLFEREKLELERTQMEHQLDVLKERTEDLLMQMDTFDQGRKAELEIELAAAKHRLLILLGLDPSQFSQVDVWLERARGGEIDPAITSLSLVNAREDVELLKNELTIALAGVYLGDSYNDAPFSSQRYEELAAERESLEQAANQVSILLSALDERIRLERQWVALQQTEVLMSPTKGILFDVLATSGEVVERGDPVLTTADCTSLIVTSSVSESLYNRLSLGDMARFRPAGSSKVFDGTVTRLAGSGAERIYRDLAVAPSEEHLERYDVVLLVPELRSDPDFECAIGRTGRVYFEPRPFDWLRRGI